MPLTLSTPRLAPEPTQLSALQPLALTSPRTHTAPTPTPIALSPHPRHTLFSLTPSPFARSLSLYFSLTLSPSLTHSARPPEDIPRPCPPSFCSSNLQNRTSEHVDRTTSCPKIAGSLQVFLERQAGKRTDDKAAPGPCSTQHPPTRDARSRDGAHKTQNKNKQPNHPNNTAQPNQKTKTPKRTKNKLQYTCLSTPSPVSRSLHYEVVINRRPWEATRAATATLLRFM